MNRNKTVEKEQFNLKTGIYYSLCNIHTRNILKFMKNTVLTKIRPDRLSGLQLADITAFISY